MEKEVESSVPSPELLQQLANHADVLATLGHNSPHAVAFHPTSHTPPFSTLAASAARETDTLTDAEREFVDRVLDHVELNPALLTNDEELADRLRSPKASNGRPKNVRQFKGGKR